MIKFSLPIVLIFCNILMLAQSREFKKRLTEVIKQNKLNKTFIYNTSKNKETTTTSNLTYFGELPNGNKVVHVMETYPAALVRHGYEMLVVINKKGKQFYYWDVTKPFKLKKGILIFKHTNKSGITYYFRQDLSKQLPKFLCVDKNDCYNYTTE
jgi:hypothetical protein